MGNLCIFTIRDGIEHLDILMKYIFALHSSWLTSVTGPLATVNIYSDISGEDRTCSSKVMLVAEAPPGTGGLT